MSIRTVEQLHDAVAADLIWRKKELSAYKLAMESNQNRPDRRQAFLRGAVALLYAHWEGFIKTTSKAYLEFVYYQRLRYNQLAPHFLALAVRPMLRAASDSTRIAAHQRVIKFFVSSLDTASVIPVKDGITTRANLSSRVLRDIIETLGLNYLEFETKAELIDEGLLELRNTIAHGEYLLVTMERYNELSAEVIAMMEAFGTQVTNAAALRKFAA